MRRVGRLLAASAGLATVAGFAGRCWFCELLGHFRVHYAAILLAAAVGLVLRRRLRAAVLMLALALVNLSLILPLYVRPAAPVLSSGPPVRAMLINLHTPSTAYQRMREAIHRVHPDILMLVELGREWHRQLAPELAGYASEYVLRDDNFGIGIFSRAPILSSNIVYAGAAGAPSVVATVALDGRLLTIVGTHPWSPVTPRRTALRDDQLEAVAELVARRRGPVMVLADLNTTSWSPVFRRFLRRTALRDSRLGFGVQPTWPALLGLAAVPIDHCLVSPEIAIEDRRTGPPVGSDHLPVIVDFRLEGPAT